MLKIYDKAVWQIDGGIPSELVENHFKMIFIWLSKHDMLNEEGKEEFDDGIDTEASLNSEQLTSEGNKFINEYYDVFFNLIAKEKYGTESAIEELDMLYEKYISVN